MSNKNQKSGEKMAIEIIIYDKSADGNSKAVYFSGTGEPEIILSGPSITAVKKGLGQIKRQRGINQVAVSHLVGVPFEDSMGIRPALQQPSEPDFSINEKFDMVESILKMVLHGDQDALLISGNGGCGKTHTVLDILKVEKHTLYSISSSKRDSRNWTPTKQSQLTRTERNWKATTTGTLKVAAP